LERKNKKGAMQWWWSISIQKSWRVGETSFTKVPKRSEREKKEERE